MFLRTIRFFIGGIFFIIGISIMCKEDAANIYKSIDKKLQK